MPTECSAECLDFGIVEGRAVEAGFDGGLVTSDAGGLLLGATDPVPTATAAIKGSIHVAQLDLVFSRLLNGGLAAI